MKNTSNKINQRGSALLLTLGILSLVLIMAMSFAFSARTTRQVAKVNADQVKARLLAESSLERVIAAMKANTTSMAYPPISMRAKNDGATPNSPNTQDNTMSFAFSSASGTISGSDWLQHYLVSKQDGGTLLAPADLAVHNAEYDDLVDFGQLNEFLPITQRFDSSYFPDYRGFQNIIVDDGTGPETIGRIAFLVIEEANKLDVNQMLSLNNKVPFVQSGQERVAPLSIDYTAAYFLYNILGDGSTTMLLSTSYEGDTVRLGLNMQELQLPHEYFTYLPSGYTGTKAQWFSYAHLWRTRWASSPGDELKYTFFSGEDIEAYWNGTTERQRFDVTGYEWGGWEHNSTFTGAQRLVTELVGETTRADFSSTVPLPDYTKTSSEAATVGFGVPHLHGLATKEQIAANMVDFCDSDSFATTDATWSGTVPTYCGNERVAYINEVLLGFKITKLTASDPANFYIKIDLGSSFELVNIFPPEAAQPDTVSILGQYKLVVSCDLTIGSFVHSLTNIVAFDQLDPPFVDSTYPYYLCNISSSVTLYDGSALALPETFPIATSSVDIKISNAAFVLLHGTSASDATILDVAYSQTEGEYTVNSGSIFLDNPSGHALTYYIEVNDPRANHVPGNWTWNDSAGTLGLENSNFSPETGADKELAVGFTGPDDTFSTAFIPDRPFRSLWELGAIHRGEPFRTLDIAGADKAIIDQVKIGPLKRTRGKFNLYSSNPAAIEKLLSNIDVTTSYDAVSSGETATVSVAPGTLPATLTTSRGDFADVLKYSTGTNDREQEALIGRTANLLTTRVDKYSVLVVGQALKELEGVTDATWAQVQQTAINPIEYPSGSKNYYSRLGTQRILAHIVRDAWRNEYKVVQMQLLED